MHETRCFHTIPFSLMKHTFFEKEKPHGQWQRLRPLSHQGRPLYLPGFRMHKAAVWLDEKRCLSHGRRGESGTEGTWCECAGCWTAPSTDAPPESEIHPENTQTNYLRIEPFWIWICNFDYHHFFGLASCTWWRKSFKYYVLMNFQIHFFFKSIIDPDDNFYRLA